MSTQKKITAIESEQVFLNIKSNIKNKESIIKTKNTNRENNYFSNHPYNDEQEKKINNNKDNNNNNNNNNINNINNIENNNSNSKNDDSEEEEKENQKDKENITQKNKNFYKFYINDTEKNKEEYHYKNNTVDTTKYNIITFLPKALFYQFIRLANVYFLLTTILQCIPVISPFTSITAIIPLVIVLGISLIREGYEDYQRKKLDKIQNSVTCLVYRDDQWIETESGNLEMGEIIIVKQNDMLPADIILIDSPLPEGVCFVETASLDGEKTLKQKKSQSLTYSKFSEIDNNGDKKWLNNINIKGSCICDKPNSELYQLNGKMNINFYNSNGNNNFFSNINIAINIDISNKNNNLNNNNLNNNTLNNDNQEINFPIDQKQLLLKGAKLKNTKWVIGIIIYTGHNCKIMQNFKEPKVKYSSVEYLMNKLLIAIFCTQCILSMMGAILRGYYYNKNLKNIPLKFYDKSFSFENFLSFFTYLLLLNTMIPISLIVTLEIVKVIQGLFLMCDIGGYSFNRKKFIKPNNFTLNEELGLVDYIFTDKTGTLTCNKMMFKYCVIGDICYEMIRDNEENNNNYQNLIEQHIKRESTKSFSDLKLRAKQNIQTINLYEMCEPKNEKFSEHPGFKNLIIYPQDKENNYNTNIELNIGYYSDFIVEFWNALALCHDCSIQKDEKGKNEYIGMSPDSIELVRAAKLQGYELLQGDSSKYRKLKIGKPSQYKENNNNNIYNNNNKNNKKAKNNNENNDNGDNNKNEIKEFEVLNILPFSSERKRESVIVKEKKNNLIKLYIKGADSVIEERLTSKQLPEILNKSKYYVDYFSSQGFRTLFVGMKILSEREYKIFSSELNEANMSLENKNQKIFEIYDKMERNIYLLGSTIVEDRLQDKVPQTIRNFRLANIKIWMLTGDKMSTALNIGLSCNLVSSDMKIFTISGISNENKDLCERVILNFAKEFSKFKGEYDSKYFYSHSNQNMINNENTQNNQKYGIVVDEKALKTIYEGEEVQKIFIEIAKDASSVICCRVSPLQKAQVVKMMKNFYKNAITLSVGDGGNDVSMIMEAHIGVGIWGEEGMRAVQSADYSIGEFKILNRLLFFHGRNLYIRNSECIKYFFYKNFVFTLTQFFYAFYTNFSGQTIIDDWYISFYNLIFTSLPLGARALLDFDVKPEDGRVVEKLLPFLYNETKSFPVFTTIKFILFLLKGIVHCAVNYYFVYYSTVSTPISNGGSMDNLWYTSVDLYTNILVIVSIELIIYTKYHTWINFVILIGTTGIVYILFLIVVHNWNFFNSYASIYDSAKSPQLWFNVLFVGGFCYIFDKTIFSFKFIFFPNLCNTLQVLRNKNGKINNGKNNLPDIVKEKLIIYENLKNNDPNEDNINENNNNYNINRLEIIIENENNENKEEDEKIKVKENFQYNISYNNNNYIDNNKNENKLKEMKMKDTLSINTNNINDNNLDSRRGFISDAKINPKTIDEDEIYWSSENIHANINKLKEFSPSNQKNKNDGNNNYFKVEKIIEEQNEKNENDSHYEEEKERNVICIKEEKEKEEKDKKKDKEKDKEKEKEKEKEENYRNNHNNSNEEKKQFVITESDENDDDNYEKDKEVDKVITMKYNIELKDASDKNSNNNSNDDSKSKNNQKNLEINGILNN